MTNCNKYQDMISRLLDEDLSDKEKIELEEHMENCEECKAMYGAFSAVSLSLSEDLEEVPENLKDNIMNAVRKESVQNNKANRKVWKSWLAAAACLALIIVGVNQYGLGKLSSAKDVASTELCIAATDSDIPDGNASEENETAEQNKGAKAEASKAEFPTSGQETNDAADSVSKDNEVINDTLDKAPIMSIVTPDGTEYSVSNEESQADLKNALNQKNENQSIKVNHGIVAPDMSDVKEYSIVFADGSEYFISVEGEDVYCTVGDETYKIAMNSSEFEAKIFNILK